MNIYTQRSHQRKICMAQRLTIVSLSIPLSLSIAGCGGEELLDILDAATGDGGKRVRLNGPIMGENRLICINNPPKIPPAALQQEIDKYLFKAIRWDSGSTVHKTIEDNRSCSYRIHPYMTVSWEQFVTDATNRQLADWGSFNSIFSAQGQRHLNVCLRDNQCEDGDILAITLNGQEIVRSELFNTASCFDVPVNSGVSYLGVYAVNGTGHKGQCDFADRNTGEITVRGADGRGITQLYSVRGGQGSYGSLMVVN